MGMEDFAMRMTLAVAILLSACAADPEYRERRQEKLAFWKAELTDARRLCRASGGYIVQHPPDIGGRYRCVR
jgi:hypothetical protein